ncbi:MAG: imidazoleglycerol-phosphate dehydratase HisB [Erysipelotrichaceae bacterium]|nr:imidazoleglycerol-phosphate dehydratase HisB [Erysipelotrichaceae bacterium]
MRQVQLERKTAETEISLFLDLDGEGKSEIDSGCGFLDHMLTLFASHGRFDLKVSGKGDTWVDYHHIVEDIGIVLGEAFKKALGDKKGIHRYGDTILAMDEALILTAIDFSGRSFLDYRMKLPTEKVGDFDTELGEEFWYGFSRKAECAMHFQMLAGKNSHHILEGSFKSMARSLREAVSIDKGFENEIPSTKGVL